MAEYNDLNEIEKQVILNKATEAPLKMVAMAVVEVMPRSSVLKINFRRIVGGLRLMMRCLAPCDGRQMQMVTGLRSFAPTVGVTWDMSSKAND